MHHKRAYRWEVAYTGGRAQEDLKAFARRTAIELGLVGEVRGMGNDRMEVYVAGPPEARAEFRDRLFRGIHGVWIRSIRGELMSYARHWSSFEINY